MAPSRGGKQQGGSSKSVTEHPPEIVGNLKQVRKQHIQNLFAILDRCLLHGDYALTAGVCSLALAAADLERYSHANIKDSRKNMLAEQLQINSVLSAVTEVVLNQNLQGDQVRRHLQQLLQHQPTHLSSEQMTNTIAMQQLFQGDLEGAYRLLSQPGRKKPAIQAALSPFRAAVCAIIRHQQWSQVMREAQQSLHQSGGWSLVLEPQAPVRLGSGSPFSTAFVYDSRAWGLLNSNPAVRDSFLECETRLKEALNLDKTQTLLVLLLVHLYVVAGRFRDAEEVAAAALTATPHDADALMLLAMVRQLAAAHPHAQDHTVEVETDRNRQTVQENNEDEEDDDVAATTKDHQVHAAYLEAVRADPLNAMALHMLLQHHDHCSECRRVAAEACMLHLDMQGMGVQLTSYDPAWHVLARCVMQLGSGLVRACQAQELQMVGANTAATPAGSHPNQVIQQASQTSPHNSSQGVTAGTHGQSSQLQQQQQRQQQPQQQHEQQQQQQQQQQAMEVDDHASNGHTSAGDDANASRAAGTPSDTVIDRAHVSDARSWGQLRAELQQRAGWWPAIQLSVATLLEDIAGAQHDSHANDTEQGEGSGGVDRESEDVVWSKLVVAAHMLGPLHVHTKAMAGYVRDCHAKQRGTLHGSQPDSSQQQQQQQGKVFWPERITWEQVQEDEQRNSPAWLLQVLHQATQVLMAEYHLMHGSQSPHAGRMQQPAAPVAVGIPSSTGIHQQQQQQQQLPVTGPYAGQASQAAGGQGGLLQEPAFAQPHQQQQQQQQAVDRQQRRMDRQQQLLAEVLQGVPQPQLKEVPASWWTAFPMERRRQGAEEQQAQVDT